MSNVPKKNIFPAGLLIEGKPCLVVGGGKVALRKTKNLIDAGAKVTIASPELIEELTALTKENKASHINRNFELNDLNEMFLVFAATNDSEINRAVVDACNERNILCCAVDSSWTDSHFVTPATFRKKGLTVSVSTGGSSCRQARLVKNSLARHADKIQSADLLVIGTNDNLISSSELTKHKLSEDEIKQRTDMLTYVVGIHEFTLLNTDQRFELLAVASREADITALVLNIMGLSAVSENQKLLKKGQDAFNYIADGTKEDVQEALDNSLNNGLADSLSRTWISSALNSGDSNSEERKKKYDNIIYSFEGGNKVQ